MVKDMNLTAVTAVVKKVVDAHDPEILLKCGCPEDEYDPESLEIAKAIDREGPVSTRGLAKIVRHVMHHSYHSWTLENPTQVSAYIPLAKDLWKALPKECRRP
jgi:hypothetical protein